MDEIENDAPMDVPHGQRKFNRRQTKACARCRKRKTKCDFKLPACSACEAASALPCMGYNVTLGKAVPRSVVGFLESRAAELELQIERQKLSNASLAAINSKTHSRAPVEVLCTASALSAALCDVIVPRDQYSYTRSIWASFQHSCSLPLPFARQQTIRQERSAPQPYAMFEFSSIPRAKADFMFKNYTEIHLPQYPCVYEPDLQESYRKCFDAPTEASSFDIFIVCMALAISANTLVWKTKADAYAASSKFWSRAKAEFGAVGQYENDLKSLQMALLLSHYASTDPNAADIFYCIGEAARICIHLGLHREPPPDMILNTLEIDTRRRLFWTTYGIERSVCSLLRLPFSLNEDVITTQFPSSLVDSCITPGGFLSGPYKKASALHFWIFRILETEVHHVLYLDKKHSGESLEEWFADVSFRLDQWHSKALEFAPEQKLEFRNVQLYFLKGRLHRPTPANRHPSRASRLETINCTMRLADEYTKQQQNDRLFYPWLAVHVLFEAAIVILDVGWNCAEWLVHEIDIPELIRYIHRYVVIIEKLKTVWADVQVCLDVLRALSTPVVQRLDAIYSGSETQHHDDKTSHLIDSFLFPDSDSEPISLSPDKISDITVDYDDATVFYGLDGAWQYEDFPLDSMFHLEDNAFSLFTKDGLDADSNYLESLYHQLN